MPRTSPLLLFLLVLLQVRCSQVPNRTHVTVPDWAKDAVWYQIFPERFRNGDPANDPTRSDAEIGQSREWAVSPWTSDWYKLQPWETDHGGGFYANVFGRFYGGDLQGVIEKLPYLSDLGVTALYCNPVFEAHSLHKYDASSFHHIDDNFGPDPIGDKALMMAETSAPETWHWTSADSLFLMLLQKAHALGMRVIIDGVFNHSGTRFWAFQNVREHQQASPYKDWYDIRSWDDPATEADEFDYKGWWDHKTLPEFAEGDSGFVPDVSRHFFDITRRWMDPDGDGDPSDGIDGWRLDVANEVSPAFWKKWRSYVKSLNPDAYIVGEIWDDASHWLSGDQFDAVMNYRFARACVQFFIDTDRRSIDAEELDAVLEGIRNDYPAETNFILQNLLDSHDTDRLASMIMNPNRDYDNMNGLRDNGTYDPRKPSEDNRDVQRLISLFQMTYLGAPMMYYGTEAGMWGADDPDDRKPMVWPGLSYEPEATSFSQELYDTPDSVAFDQDMFDWYKNLIHIRRRSSALTRGSFTSLRAKGDIFIFERAYESDTMIVALNRSGIERSITIPRSGVWVDQIRNTTYDLNVPMALGRRSGVLLERSSVADR